MNRIFKTVWSAVRRCLVVVNEATKNTTQARLKGSITKCVGIALFSNLLTMPVKAEIVLPTWIDSELNYTYPDFCWDDNWSYSTTITENGKLTINFSGSGGGLWWQEADDVHVYGQVIINGTSSYTGSGHVVMDWNHGNNQLHIYDGGSFSVTHSKIQTKVQNIINEGTFNNAGIYQNNNGRGSKTTNNGIFVNTGTINSSKTWSGTGQINNEGGTVNISGGVFTSDTLVGGLVKLSGGNATVNNLHDSTRYTITGGTLTTGINQVFASTGSMGQQALNYITGTVAEVPQAMQTLLSDYFQKYVKGTLRENLAQIISFQGGELHVDGTGLTETQRDDLSKIFKETFFIRFANAFSKLSALWLWA